MFENYRDRPIKVAISGKPRAGKDATGVILHRVSGSPRDGFAAPLYKGLREMGMLKKNRTWLQDIGEYFAQQDEYHWPNLLEKRNPDLHNEGIIITDLRRPGEVEFCKKHGIMLVRLDTDDFLLAARGAEMDRIDQPVEKYLDDFKGWHIRMNTRNLNPERIALMILTQYHLRKGEPNYGKAEEEPEPERINPESGGRNHVARNPRTGNVSGEYTGVNGRDSAGGATAEPGERDELRTANGRHADREPEYRPGNGLRDRWWEDL